MHDTQKDIQSKEPKHTIRVNPNCPLAYDRAFLWVWSASIDQMGKSHFAWKSLQQVDRSWNADVPAPRWVLQVSKEDERAFSKEIPSPILVGGDSYQDITYAVWKPWDGHDKTWGNACGTRSGFLINPNSRRQKDRLKQVGGSRFKFESLTTYLMVTSWVRAGNRPDGFGVAWSIECVKGGLKL